MIIEHNFNDDYHTAIKVEFSYYERCYLSVSPIKVEKNSIGFRADKNYKGFHINFDKDFMKRKNSKKLEKLNNYLEQIKDKYNFVDIVLNQDIDKAREIALEAVNSIK